MSWKTKYNIEFKGLKEGLHVFEFEVDDKFFEHFDESQVEKGKVFIRLSLEKRSSFIKLDFDLNGQVELTCDRCLELYSQDISYETEMFVKYGEDNEDEGENIIWVNPEEHNINVVQVIYEFVALSIPLRHVHPKNSDGKRACNKEMLKKLKKYTRPEKEEKTETDPRWDVLKSLGNNN